MREHVVPAFVGLMQEERAGSSAVVVSTEVITKAAEAVQELVRIVEEKRPRSEGVGPAARLAACAIVHPPSGDRSRRAPRALPASSAPQEKAHGPGPRPAKRSPSRAGSSASTRR